MARAGNTLLAEFYSSVFDSKRNSTPEVFFGEGVRSFKHLNLEKTVGWEWVGRGTGAHPHPGCRLCAPPPPHTHTPPPSPPPPPPPTHPRTLRVWRSAPVVCAPGVRLVVFLLKQHSAALDRPARPSAPSRVHTETRVQHADLGRGCALVINRRYLGLPRRRGSQAQNNQRKG